MLAGDKVAATGTAVISPASVECGHAPRRPADRPRGRAGGRGGLRPIARRGPAVVARRGHRPGGRGCRAVVAGVRPGDVAHRRQRDGAGHARGGTPPDGLVRSHGVGPRTRNDLDADHRRLSAAGVEFIEQPTEYDGLRIATLKDPEGNLIQLFQPIS
ncbi:MAG TPA: VOC family protein [Chloroflexota bacterium]|nr:VOC family protein [Chloroflexota bacterium]